MSTPITRTKIKTTLNHLQKERESVQTFMIITQNTIPQRVKNLLEEDIEGIDRAMEHLKAVLSSYHASCSMCGEQQELETPVIAFVCRKCDERISKHIRIKTR